MNTPTNTPSPLDVLEELAASRPGDDVTWADSPTGLDVFARSRILSRAVVPDGRRPRRRVVVGLAGIALVAGGGIAVAFTSPHGSSPRNRDLSLVMCADAFTLHADLTEASDPEQTAAGAIAGCTHYWRATDSGSVPANLVSCVYPSAPNNAGGGRAVFPAPAGLSGPEACAQLGASFDNS